LRWTIKRHNVLNMKGIKDLNIHALPQRLAFFTALFLLVLGLVYPDFCRGGTAVIPVHYRKASETLPVVNHFLSPAGIVTVDDRTNSLILIDTDEVIRNVKSYLDKFDTPLRRVKIRLRFNEKQSSRDRGASVDGRISGKNWEISTGRGNPDGLDIRLKDEKHSRRQSSEYIIHTTSGSSAYILTGKRVPYGGRWASICRRNSVCKDTISYQQVDTGMEIKPVIVGDHANIEITPRISHMDSDGQSGIVHFTAASTWLSVPLGQWVTIGGTDKTSNEIFKAILAGGGGNESEALVITLMLETY
jgi:hypothetical protein